MLSPSSQSPQQTSNNYLVMTKQVQKLAKVAQVPLGTVVGLIGRIAPDCLL